MCSPSRITQLPRRIGHEPRHSLLLRGIVAAYCLWRRTTVNEVIESAKTYMNPLTSLSVTARVLRTMPIEHSKV